MPTKKPTTRQREAYAAVQKYLEEHHMIADIDEWREEGYFRISHNERDDRDVGYEEPSEEFVQGRAETLREIRKLSPLIFGSYEIIDEWVDIDIRIRRQPRRPRPSPIKSLQKKVLEQMPAWVKEHRHFKAMSEHVTSSNAEAIRVYTSRIRAGRAQGTHESIDLSWSLRGNTLEGWEIVVKWGVHQIRKKISTKKLTPKMIFAAWNELLDVLGDDKFDALGWIYNFKLNGQWVTTFSTKANPPRKALNEHDVLADDGTVRLHRGDLVVATNRLTEEVVELNVGDPFPPRMLDISIG